MFVRLLSTILQEFGLSKVLTSPYNKLLKAVFLEATENKFVLNLDQCLCFSGKSQVRSGD